MQGDLDALQGFGSQFGCLPLAQRSIVIPETGRSILAILVMGLAVMGAASGLLPAAVSFALATLVSVLAGILPARRIYESVDWSVIVLLGAMIPVGEAVVLTGTADLIARIFLDNIADGRPVLALVIVMVLTMTLSDFINNAATAAVMCPIAVSIADQLKASSDCFLMAVAIGASSAFLTPIGHQNNTLILGPGGFRFGNYWRMGLPLEILLVALGIPLLLAIWPL